MTTTIEQAPSTKQEVMQAWKNLAAKKANTSMHHAFYVIIRALQQAQALEVAEPDFNTIAVGAKPWAQRAFSPTTNKNKLANGCTPYHTLEMCLWQLGGPNGLHFTRQTAASLGIVLSEQAMKNIQRLARQLQKELTQ